MDEYVATAGRLEAKDHVDECNFCKKKTVKLLDISYTFKTDYLCITFNHSFNNELDLFERFDPDFVSIGTFRYACILIVVYRQAQNHFFCWKRKGKEWILIDSLLIIYTTKSAQVMVKISQLYMMILEKL